MRENAIIQQIGQHFKGVALSYAHIFFSNKLWLGLVLLAVTFFDLGTGFSGIAAVVICQICSLFFSFNKELVFNGAYTYNALMTGLAMGSHYQLSVPYFAVLIVATILCFFLTIFISGRLATIGLPFLSLPFLITIWVLLTGLSDFNEIHLGAKELFSLQLWLPNLFTQVNSFVKSFGWYNFLHTYLCSLSANLFQYNDLAGIIIAFALLLRSRMAFALSIYGFALGYAFYHYLAGDFTPLIYSYIGFNFILTAIALGGFYLVPSTKSHLLLLFAIPVTALLLSALNTLFTKLHLPLYSLPFNIIVLLIIGALQMRQQAHGLQLVSFQQYSPELNHYKHIYHQKRFAGQYFYHLLLPVMGEWRIFQGYNGNITHKEEWQHALDFEVRDEQAQTFNGTGFDVKNYYCYDLPVLAPAGGYVTTIKDSISDNAIGQINLQENWGNTIIIKHAEGLYSKLSHLKATSFKVKEGDYVMAGELVASCGNSGRSPEPHLHFQVQSTPYIGSKTLPYPIAYYLVKSGNDYHFRSFDVPKEGELVRNIVPTASLTNAFNFVPGKELFWQINMDGKTIENNWTVYVDASNKSYLYCNTTKAVAYFYNDGTLFYFTDFYGSKKSFLYRFHLSFQKILLGNYKGAALNDHLLPQSFFDPATMAIQDFVAPFFHFIKGIYKFKFGEKNKEQPKDTIIIKTKSNGSIFGHSVKEITGEMLISNNGISTVTIVGKNHKTLASCVYS